MSSSPAPSDRDEDVAAQKRRWGDYKADRIVTFWLTVIVALTPGVFLGWAYGLGIILGYLVLRPLFDWKERADA